MKKRVAVVSLLVIILSLFGIQSDLLDASFTLDQTEVLSSSEERALVIRVVDGDTIELSTGEKVRYIGIDTPELRSSSGPECFAVKAKEINKELVEGKTVRLEKDISDKDRYGRLLRYVYIDDLLVNEELVKEGYALAASFPPDIALQSLFVSRQIEARENSRGLWSECL